jgi:type VII secretion-associated serine protease mycosin
MVVSRLFSTCVSVRFWCTVSLLALAPAGCGYAGDGAFPKARTRVVADSVPRYANRVVVKYRTGTSGQQIQSFAQRFALRSLRDVSSIGVSVLGLSGTQTVVKALAQIQGAPEVQYAEPAFLFKLAPVARSRKPSGVRRLAFSVDDGSVNRLPDEVPWGFNRIGLNQVRAINAGSSQVVVAVVDTGIDLSHPDLTQQLVPGINTLPNASGPDDDHGHGTHVAGVIAARPYQGRGLVGIAPRCRLMPIKVLDREGKGATDDIVAGIVWAVNNGASVINLSLGGTGGSRALREAVDYAIAKDVLLVAAMGNQGENLQEYPAGYPGVIAVGASDESDQKAGFSNTGSWISVCAPGENILSTLPTRPVHVVKNEGKQMYYDWMDGTSMAAPFVAGVAALLRAQYPNLSAQVIKQRLEKTADDLGSAGYDEEFGFGCINAARALRGS